MLTSANYKQNIGDPRIQIGEKIQRVLTDPQYVISRDESNFYFGVDRPREFIEMHFYVPNTETLVYSAAIPFNSGISEGSGSFIKLTDVDDTDKMLNFELFLWNQDGQLPINIQDNYLSELQSGFYDVVINFFADEVGTYEDINWRIKSVSPSRTEIVLHAAPETDGSGVVNFDDKITRDYEQFTTSSIYFNDFREILLENINPQDDDTLDSMYQDVEDELTQTQTDFIDANYNDFENDVIHILKNVAYDISDWMATEKSSNRNPQQDVVGPPGGARYRIQQDRFEKQLDEILDSVVGDHEVMLNLNASGQIPFIINE